MKCFLSVVLTLLLAAGATAAPPKARPLEIYFVDVEGGAATLIVAPSGESLLVDTGWQRPDGRDARRIHRAAQQAGLKRIDYLLTTHFHMDHFGGLGELARLLPIGKFYDPGRRTELAEDKKAFPKLNEVYLEVTKGQSHPLRPGDQIPLKRAPGAAPLALRVLASNGDVIKGGGPPNPECQNAPLQKDDPTDNARSTGFLLAFGRFRFLDLGDLTWNLEHQLACPSNLVGTVTLYQVTHHGMNISNNRALLASVKPRVAIMNNGPRKAGHPDVVKWLRALPGLEDLWQVHRNMASSDQDNAAPEFIANLGPEEGCDGHTIQVSVVPDGNSFTVTNTRTGQSRSYRTR